MGSKYKVGMVSLGCPKNLVDTEIMLGLLRKAGFTFTRKEGEADILIVNTCSFIAPARKESMETISELSQWKKDGNCKGLIVCGCLPQLWGERVFRVFPQVDALLNPGDFPYIVEAVKSVLSGKRFFPRGPLEFLYDHTWPRIISTPSHWSYLKIAEGCDNRCHYCTIPRLRGKFRSRTMESILEEAGFLVEKGVKEIILIAQDTTLYGKDLYGRSLLSELLKKLVKIPDLQWLRIMYTHPAHFTPRLIRTMSNHPQICKYIDLPLQHINDVILRNMGRPISKEGIYSLISELRKRIPRLTLRTTLMVGFPGEGEREFRELEEFVKDIRFERLGVFTYSREEGTPAARLPGQVPDEIKEERYHRIMSLQKKISLEKNRLLLGKRIKVLIDACDSKTSFALGRSEGDAPEIDNRVHIQSKVTPGEFVEAKITHVLPYDLFGEIFSRRRS